RRLSAVLGLRFPNLGRQVSRRLVSADDAFSNRTDEEDRPHAALSSGPHPELLQSAKGDFKRYDRGLKQQSESHHEKILWISNVSRHRTGSLPLSRQAPGAGNRPQILLTRLFSSSECAPEEPGALWDLGSGHQYRGLLLPR